MSEAMARWYQFALQQMAAESMLDRNVLEGRDLAIVLDEGNTDTRRSEGGQATGYTRMPAAQSAEFIANYEIAAHRANDATGMSATLLRWQEDGQTRYTLSVRSTEFKDYDKGGDYERDNLGANRSILAYGFAHAQLAALEDFFAQTVAPIVGTERIYVTGYSLGGHLATVFTEMHEEQVDWTTQTSYVAFRDRFVVDVDDSVNDECAFAFDAGGRASFRPNRCGRIGPSSHQAGRKYECRRAKIAYPVVRTRTSAGGARPESCTSKARNRSGGFSHAA